MYLVKDPKRYTIDGIRTQNVYTYIHSILKTSETNLTSDGFHREGFPMSHGRTYIARSAKINEKSNSMDISISLRCIYIVIHSNVHIYVHATYVLIIIRLYGVYMSGPSGIF